MRKLILIAIMAIPAIFASCSQETEDIQGPVRKDIGRRETVTDLTRSLKEYDARFLIRQDENCTKAQARLPHITYSKLDMVKIALADVKGGLRGIGGGAAGVVVGAIDEYTDDVVYQIQHPNVDVLDRRTLYQGIQIAYASVLYSKNMDFHNQ